MGKSSIFSRIQSCEREKNYTKAEIDEAERKIADLNAIYKTVSEFKDEVIHIRKNVQGMDKDYDGVWKGYNANDAYERCEDGSVYIAYSNYENEIDSLMEQINEDIYAQKAIRNQKYGVFEGLVNLINSLWVEWGNAVD